MSRQILEAFPPAAVEASPYDGILGKLPDWVPGNVLSDFCATRSRLQTYVHDDLLAYLAHLHHYWEHPFEENPHPQPPLEIHQEIITLVHFQQAVRLGKEAGLALLTDPDHAQRVMMGENYSRDQSTKARKPRGRVSEDGETLADIIRELALSREHMEDSAKELWPHFFHALEMRGLQPKDEDNQYRYGFGQNHWRVVTFGRFANIVSDHRTSKKSR